LLTVNNLACARGDRELFTGLSLTVRRGEVLHIKGRNGAGKTTLLRTLCGLSRPASGEIRWNHEHIKSLDDEYRSHIAYIGHGNGIQGELTPKENLAVSASLAGAGGEISTDETLHKIGLNGLNHLPSKLLSQGQKRRLALARLLVLNKPLWLLDEPFSALDTASVTLMENILIEHLSSNGMIIMTSHQEIGLHNAQVQYVDLDRLRRRPNLTDEPTVS
jgi:heme exporter protein A